MENELPGQFSDGSFYLNLIKLFNQIKSLFVYFTWHINIIAECLFNFGKGNITISSKRWRNINNLKKERKKGAPFDVMA